MSHSAGPTSSRRWRFVAEATLALVLIAAGLGTWHVVAPRSSPLDLLFLPETLPAIPRTQRPQTLDPSLFKGKAAEAYRVARERPELLERMPCYCGCYLKSGHQNNLDCFGDRHASTCDVCTGIALRAAELEKKGYSIEDIKRLIDREFASHGQ